MKLSRILKTVLLIDFISGLIIAIKESFKSKKTLNYPFESNFSLLYISSSLVSVANSKLGPSTIASTGQDSSHKPQ